MSHPAATQIGPTNSTLLLDQHTGTPQLQKPGTASHPKGCHTTLAASWATVDAPATKDSQEFVMTSSAGCLPTLREASTRGLSSGSGRALRLASSL